MNNKLFSASLLSVSTVLLMSAPASSQAKPDVAKCKDMAATIDKIRPKIARMIEEGFELQHVSCDVEGGMPYLTMEMLPLDPEVASVIEENKDHPEKILGDDITGRWCQSPEAQKITDEYGYISRFVDAKGKTLIEWKMTKADCNS